MKNTFKMRTKDNNLFALMERTLFRYADKCNMSVEVLEDRETYVLTPKQERKVKICLPCADRACDPERGLVCTKPQSERCLSSCECCPLRDKR